MKKFFALAAAAGLSAGLAFGATAIAQESTGGSAGSSGQSGGAPSTAPGASGPTTGAQGATTQGGRATSGTADQRPTDTNRRGVGSPAARSGAVAPVGAPKATRMKAKKSKRSSKN